MTKQTYVKPILLHVIHDMIIVNFPYFYFLLWICFQICSKPKTARVAIKLQPTTKKTRTSCVGFKTINESSIEDVDFSSPSHNLSNFFPTPFSIIIREACLQAGASGEFLFKIRFMYSGLP